jgi:hypothetical protein
LANAHLDDAGHPYRFHPSIECFRSRTSQSDFPGCGRKQLQVRARIKVRPPRQGGAGAGQPALQGPPFPDEGLPCRSTLANRLFVLNGLSEFARGGFGYFPLSIPLIPIPQDKECPS